MTEEQGVAEVQPRRVDPLDLEAIEIDLLLEAVHRAYGFDFREYSRASLNRRVRGSLQAEHLSSVSALQDRLLRDPEAVERFVLRTTVHTTAMFRDPPFYRALRSTVVPYLRTWPFVRIWDIGSSTGEEAYSLAIVLAEEGLLQRALIYATDLSPAVLDRARTGVYPLKLMQEYTKNYIASGGAQSFSEYYQSAHGDALMRRDLAERIVFAQHDLTVDGSFNEFQLILCRNVLIYFREPLRDRVHRLAFDSLAPLGVLGLGSREVLRSTPFEAEYAPLDAENRLYQRRAPG